MKANFGLSKFFAQLLTIGLVLAQFEGPYSEALLTDAKSGIIFDNHLIERDLAPGGLEFGVVLPSKLDKPDYIGRIVGPKDGWTGISHNGNMKDNLLLAAWADGDEVRHSFRFATEYYENAVNVYNGSSKLSEIRHNVNKTHFEFVYRCNSCFTWKFKGKEGSQPLNGASVRFGFAQSGRKLSNRKNPNVSLIGHESFGPIFVNPKKASNSNYNSWAAKAHARRALRARQTSPENHAPSPTLPKISPISSLPELPNGERPKLPIPISTLGAFTMRRVYRRQVSLPKISPPPVPPGLPESEDPRVPIPVSSIGMPPIIPITTTGIIPVPVSPTAAKPPGALPTNLPKDKETVPHLMHCRSVVDCVES